MSKTAQSIRKNMLWLLEKSVERKRRKNYVFWIQNSKCGKFISDYGIRGAFGKLLVISL